MITTFQLNPREEKKRPEKNRTFYIFFR